MAPIAGRFGGKIVKLTRRRSRASPFTGAPAMSDMPHTSSEPILAIPADDLQRRLTVAVPDDLALPRIAIAGGVYTVLVNGAQTAGRYCLIEMLVPAGGGPPPHRHDFEEMFTLLEGLLEFTFAARNPPFAQARPSTSRPMRRISSLTHQASPRACFACVRLPVRRGSSWRWETRLRAAARRRLI